MTNDQIPMTKIKWPKHDMVLTIAIEDFIEHWPLKIGIFKMEARTGLAPV